MRDLVTRWLPPIVWTAVILAASGDEMSAVHSEHWLTTILRTLLRTRVSPEAFEVLHLLVRKAAHLVSYLILGWLYARALRTGGGHRARQAVAAVALSLLVAAADESRQAGTTQRTGTASDVAIDGCGAIAAQVLRRRRNERASPVLSSTQS